MSVLTANELLRWFQSEYNYLWKEMENCTHHYSSTFLNPYHLEGSIASHTLLVLKNAENHNSYDAISMIVALLHDVGKVYTREEKHEKNRVSFINHEQLSYFHSIGILNKMERHGLIDSNFTKIDVLQAISLHGTMYDVVDTDNISEDQMKKYMRMYRKDDALFLRLIKQIYFDTTGRFFITDKPKLLDLSYIFSTYKDNPFWETLEEEMVKEDFRKKANDKEIVLTIGLPCSGKSTYVAENYGFHDNISRDGIVLEMAGTTDYNDAWQKVDQKEVDKEFNKRLKNAFVAGRNIVIDRTHMSKKSRNQILANVPKGYSKIGVMFNTELKTVFERNRMREGKYIDAKIIEDMMKRFMVPTHNEFDTLIWRF